MKCLILLTLISVSFSYTNVCCLDNAKRVILEDPKFNYSTDILLNVLKQELDNINIRDGGITTIINDYADKVFSNVQKLILRHGLDPVELPDEVLKLFPTGSISLSEGWLQDTATIARYKNVSVSYSSFTKKLTLIIPIQFSALMSTYNYHAKIFILNMSGNIQGKITDLRAYTKISLDLKNFQTSLDTFDIKESGSISLTFSGNGLLDWVTSRMTAAVTFFLHPVIIRIIEFIVKGGLETAITTTNKVISNVLHNQSSIHTTTENYLWLAEISSTGKIL